MSIATFFSWIARNLASNSEETPVTASNNLQGRSVTAATSSAMSSSADQWFSMSSQPQARQDQKVDLLQQRAVTAVLGGAAVTNTVHLTNSLQAAIRAPAQQPPDSRVVLDSKESKAQPAYKVIEDLPLDAMDRLDLAKLEKVPLEGQWVAFSAILNKCSGNWPLFSFQLNDHTLWKKKLEKAAPTIPTLSLSHWSVKQSLSAFLEPTGANAKHAQGIPEPLRLDFKALTTLRLDSFHLYDADLMAISNQKNLERLVFDGRGFTSHTAAGLKSLTKLINLKKLVLLQTNFLRVLDFETLELWMKSFSTLVELEIIHTDWLDTTFYVLMVQRLKKLKRLLIVTSRLKPLKETYLTLIAEALPELRKLELRGFTLTVETVEALKVHKKLKVTVDA